MNILSAISKKYGYTSYEVGLATYITCALIIAVSLLVYNQAEVQHALTPHYTTKTTANGTVSKDAPKSDPAPSTYTLQTYDAHDFKVSMKFDPNSYAVIDYVPAQIGDNGKAIAGSSNDEVNIFGNPLDSTNVLVVEVTKDPANSDGLLSPTTDPELALVADFNTSIMGKPYTVYRVDSTVPEVLVNIQAGQTWYWIQIGNYTRGGANADTPIGQTTVQTILQSLDIH